LANIKKAIED